MARLQNRCVTTAKKLACRDVPSYYKESLLKSLIEATAVSRPIITTNIGCRETVEDGVNGYLIPIKSSDALANKLNILLNNVSLKKKMGESSWKIAERNFSIDEVIKNI